MRSINRNPPGQGEPGNNARSIIRVAPTAAEKSAASASKSLGKTVAYAHREVGTPFPKDGSFKTDRPDAQIVMNWANKSGVEHELVKVTIEPV